jgi:hypothetical protein
MQPKMKRGISSLQRLDEAKKLASPLAASHELQTSWTSICTPLHDHFHRWNKHLAPCIMATQGIANEMSWTI